MLEMINTAHTIWSSGFWEDSTLFMTEKKDLEKKSVE